MSKRNAWRVSLVVIAGSRSDWLLPHAAAAAAEAEAARSRSSFPSRRPRRYESEDRPLFQKKVKALCSSCEDHLQQRRSGRGEQQQQAEAALTKGAKVLVLDPVDAASAGAIVARAKQSKVPVVQL